MDDKRIIWLNIFKDDIRKQKILQEYKPWGDNALWWPPVLFVGLLLASIPFAMFVALVVGVAAGEHQSPGGFIYFLTIVVGLFSAFLLRLAFAELRRKRKYSDLAKSLYGGKEARQPPVLNQIRKATRLSSWCLFIGIGFLALAILTYMFFASIIIDYEPREIAHNGWYVSFNFFGGTSLGLSVIFFLIYIFKDPRKGVNLEELLQIEGVKTEEDGSIIYIEPLPKNVRGIVDTLPERIELHTKTVRMAKLVKWIIYSILFWGVGGLGFLIGS